MAIGVFIGCLPLYGLHIFLCLMVCLPLELDLLVAYLAANISNPLFAPFLITLEIEVGSFVLTGKWPAFTVAHAKQTGILGFVWEAGVGSVFVGAALAVAFAALTYAVARAERPARVGVPTSLVSAGAAASAVSDSERIEQAIFRTIERYRRAPRGDRFYVAAKLRLDPVAQLLSQLAGELGQVLDVGAGRGQFGLLLWELGKTRHLLGFDSDPRKVSAAQLAGGADAKFEVRDLLDLPATDADTALLIDVLHYLPLPEQKQLLERVAARVPRGRVVIRELDHEPGARSRFTRFMEWLAQGIGYNRGRAKHFYRPARELVADLSALGFRCEVRGASEGTPFGNVLVIASR